MAKVKKQKHWVITTEKRLICRGDKFVQHDAVYMATTDFHRKGDVLVDIADLSDDRKVSPTAERISTWA